MKKKILFLLPTLLISTLSSCNFSNFLEPSDELRIHTPAKKTSYYVNDAFSLDGLIVTSKKTNFEIYDYTTDPYVEGCTFESGDVGEQTIYIKHPQYKQTSYKINVNALPDLPEDPEDPDTPVTPDPEEPDTPVTPDPDEPTEPDTPEEPKDIPLYVASNPNKTTYEVGDAFSSSGLVIKDENNNTITGYTLSIKDGQILNTEGNFTVTVSKTNYVSCNFSIKVNPKQNIEVLQDISLDIYYLNDTHGSFVRDSVNKEAGMSYISSYIKNASKGNEEYSLVLSGGDMFQGGYESNMTKGQIMIETMNEMGFDAMAIGNHEFDWGEEYFYEYEKTAEFPLLACNIFYTNGQRPSWAKPYTVIERENLTIGIIGAIKENVGSSIVGSVSNNFSFPNPNTYIKEFSTQLRLNEGCDIIIALIHDEGMEGYSGSPTNFNAITQIDSKTNEKYVDAMFFGHDHVYKSGFYNQVPYLETSGNAQKLGIMSLKLKADGTNYNVDVTNSTVKNIDAYNTCKTSDPNIDAIANKAEYRELIKSADESLYTFSKSYTKAQFTYVVCQAMLWFVNNNKKDFGNVTYYFASHNTGGVRENVSQGDFTRRDLVKTFPFDNLLSAQVCTSSNISYMENNSYYETYKENIVYSNGVTNAISITYITENSTYGPRCQQSYKNYNHTATDALVAYLLSGVNTSL